MIVNGGGRLCILAKVEVLGIHCELGGSIWARSYGC